MSSPIISNICPVCNNAIICTGFSYHWCDDAYVVTLDGSFHSYQRSESLARAYMYRTARRQESAGMVVEIAPAAPVVVADEYDSAYDDYYGGDYLTEEERAQERAELLAAAAEHEAMQQDVAAAIDRLRFLGVEQAAAATWADDQDLPIISLIETPAPMPTYTRLAA